MTQSSELNTIKVTTNMLKSANSKNTEYLMEESALIHHLKGKKINQMALLDLK